MHIRYIPEQFVSTLLLFYWMYFVRRPDQTALDFLFLQTQKKKKRFEKGERVCDVKI